MNLFLDTSALVRLYVDEAGSAAVREAVQEAAVLAVCRIAWAEFHAAMAARGRMDPALDPLLDTARSELARHWPSYVKVEVTQHLVERAAALADAFALRGYDSVQLAAAEMLHGADAGPVVFACYDRRLANAAAVLGIGVLGGA